MNKVIKCKVLTPILVNLLRKILTKNYRKFSKN